MKSFKQHLEEHSGHFSRQWLDQDTIPSAPHALEALNSLIGQMAEQEYLNPKVGIEKLQSGLGKLGYHFEAPTLDSGDGQYSLPLSYGNGTFEIFIKACGPTGAYVYRYEKERLKWCQRRSYGGASTPKYYNFFKSDY